MNWKWKPSKTARREFAIKMQTDQEFANAYHERKEECAEKRRKSSKFDYTTAGGNYVPTREQFIFAFENYHLARTDEEKTVFNALISAYSCNDRVHHDFIHIVNEIRRNNA